MGSSIHSKRDPYNINLLYYLMTEISCCLSLKVNLPKAKYAVASQPLPTQQKLFQLCHGD
jgi:hypothetical protein